MKQAFTLLELIITIVIVGVLATLGFTQYTITVEKARTAEAIAQIGFMRKLAYEYYFKYGSLDGIQNSDVEVDYTCRTTNFYSYLVYSPNPLWCNLAAYRCTGGGKAPNASRGYIYYLQYYPGSGQETWHCYYTDDNSTCFGLPW
ncbi:MAG: type II secretion system protein [Candidatus Omnitrophota bacterium]